MRVKETGNDYRYFPEPDIPFVILTDEMIENARKTIPMLPDERREKYISLGVSEINANKLIQNRSLSDYFNTLLDEKINFKIASNLLLGDISAYLNKNEKIITETTLTKDRFIELVNIMDKNILTSKNLKDILEIILESTKTIDEIIKENEANPDSVADYKNGHDRAIKYLMGQVMKETKGKANPKLAMDILNEELQ
jgi:aspartyl-tRNA(Asn)/glutamyl-tRNA(Gln) amidotransferase subunit B